MLAETLYFRLKGNVPHLIQSEFVMPVGCFPGTSPIVLAFPYVGTDLSPQVHSRLSEEGRSMRDTDWHLMRLFEGVSDHSTTVFARFSRLLADVNALPGQPIRARGRTVASSDTNDGSSARLWDNPPRLTERQRWHSAFSTPYHATLAAQVARLRAIHGRVIVVECVVQRSASEIEAEFPADVAVLSRLGLSSNAIMTADFIGAMKRVGSHNVDFSDLREPDRTMRNHGKPRAGVQALQLRLSPMSYLAEPEEPWPFDPAKAEVLRTVLDAGLQFLSQWEPVTPRRVFEH